MQVVSEEISLPKLHLVKHRLRQGVPILRGPKIALAKDQVLAPERVNSIYAMLRQEQRPSADIHGVHLNLLPRKTPIQESHDNRIRFFAGGTWNAEQPEHVRRGRLPGFCNR